MSRQSVWAFKVMALVQGGNSQAALAQMKVAPTVKDLERLRDLLNSVDTPQAHANINAALQEQIAALAAPRLHRSP